MAGVTMKASEVARWQNGSAYEYKVPPRFRGDAREGTEARRAWSVPLREERLQDPALRGVRMGTASAV
jgi:hypothetical protein